MIENTEKGKERMTGDSRKRERLYIDIRHLWL